VIRKIRSEKALYKIRANAEEDTRNRWNSQPLTETCIEFLRALRERGASRENGLNLKMGEIQPPLAGHYCVYAMCLFHDPEMWSIILKYLGIANYYFKGKMH
jgi:hypothetical protein